MFNQYFAGESKQNLQKGIVGASVAFVFGYSLWAYVLPWYRNRLISEQKRKIALDKLKSVDTNDVAKEIESMQSQITAIRQQENTTKKRNVSQPRFSLTASQPIDKRVSSATRSQITTSELDVAIVSQIAPIRHNLNNASAQPQTRLADDNSVMDISASLLRIEQDLEYQTSLMADWEKKAIRESKQMEIDAFQANREVIRSRVLPEPEESTDGIVSISFRFKVTGACATAPDKSNGKGSRVNRKFLVSDKIDSILDFAEGSDLCTPSSTTEVFLSFPKKILLRGTDSTLADFGITSQCLVWVHILDE